MRLRSGRDRRRHRLRLGFRPWQRVVLRLRGEARSAPAPQTTRARAQRPQSNFASWPATPPLWLQEMGRFRAWRQAPQVTGQRVGPLRDVAGAQQHDIVAGPGQTSDKAGERKTVFQRRDIAMAAGFQPCDQIIAAGPFDGLFACGIDGRDKDGIGVVEAGAEVVEQRMQPRVAMRLHDGDDLARGGCACRLENPAISTG